MIVWSSQYWCCTVLQGMDTGQSMGQIKVLLSGSHVLLVASRYRLSYFRVCIKFNFNT